MWWKARRGCDGWAAGRASSERVSSWLPSSAMCLTTPSTTTLSTMVPARLRLGRTRNVPCRIKPCVKLHLHFTSMQVPGHKSANAGLPTSEHALPPCV